VSDLRSMYREMGEDPFPSTMTISFGEGTAARAIRFEKHQWDVGGEKKGLRYGENPGQAAALYRPVDGNLVLGGVETIQAGRYLVSDAELLQGGKHPGKINLTDVDAALGILKYLDYSAAAVVVKHNNPSGAAIGRSVADAYHKAFEADRVAAFGGAVTVNKAVDKDTAELILNAYTEVVAAPDFEPGVLELFERKKNLRVMKIRRIDELSEFRVSPFLDFKSLMDGGIIVQDSYRSKLLSEDDLLPAECEYQGKTYRVDREPTGAEKADMVFGWFVEAGVTSNSVLYVKDGVTVGIGTGEQDRVGVAEIARDKAYKRRAQALAVERFGKVLAECTNSQVEAVAEEIEDTSGGLKGSIMVSDAFFPFRDGVDVGLREGVTAVLQPGGSLRDWESIEACNEHGAAMAFTGQRSFKH
jgi:phosphoribosylaminoimidazolecarboxamide formyltransferase/IMP cyclohydrolase